MSISTQDGGHSPHGIVIVARSIRVNSSHGRSTGVAGSYRQGALTEWRNLPTSSLRRLLSPDSDFAAERTCEEAEPVSLAPRCTSVMLAETCWVPCAACCK